MSSVSVCWELLLVVSAVISYLLPLIYRFHLSNQNLRSSFRRCQHCSIVASIFFFLFLIFVLFPGRVVPLKSLTLKLMLVSSVPVLLMGVTPLGRFLELFQYLPPPSRWNIPFHRDLSNQNWYLRSSFRRGRRLSSLVELHLFLG